MDRNLQEEFSGYGYVVLTEDDTPKSAKTTFSEEWHDTYFNRRFFEIDPIFMFAKECGYRSGVALLSEKDMASPLFEEAKLHGANSNFISISNLGGSKMIFGGVHEGLAAEGAQRAHQLCQATHRATLMKRIDILTDAQIEIMEMSEEGMLDKQIVDDLKISMSALYQRKRGITEKIGVSSFRTALNMYSLRKWGGLLTA